MTAADRTVHARCRSYEIVRYDRAGKWYIEFSGGTRRSVGVVEAARLAMAGVRLEGGSVTMGLVGGRVFDRWVQVR